MSTYRSDHCLHLFCEYTWFKIVAQHWSLLQVWCLDGLPDRSGFVSCSADKHVKVWKWGTSEESSSQLSLTQDKSINTGQDVLCVKISPDSKLIACSLVSNVIKVLLSYSLPVMGKLVVCSQCHPPTKFTQQL